MNLTLHIQLFHTLFLSIGDLHKFTLYCFNWCPLRRPKRTTGKPDSYSVVTILQKICGNCAARNTVWEDYSMSSNVNKIKSVRRPYAISELVSPIVGLLTTVSGMSRTLSRKYGLNPNTWIDLIDCVFEITIVLPTLLLGYPLCLLMIPETLYPCSLLTPWRIPEWGGVASKGISTPSTAAMKVRTGMSTIFVSLHHRDQ